MHLEGSPRYKQLWDSCLGFKGPGKEGSRKRKGGKGDACGKHERERERERWWDERKIEAGGR